MSEKAPSPNHPPVLEDAWRRFAMYDQSSLRAQKIHVQLRVWLLAIGVVATASALTYEQLKDAVADARWLSPLWALVILAPIVATVLAGGAASGERGMQYVLLRGAAETIKGETYRYRCRVGAYRHEKTAPPPDAEEAGSEEPPELSRDAQLAARAQSIGERLMKSSVMQASLPAYGGPLPPKYGAAEGDDGFSELTPQRFIELRLNDQLSYFRRKAVGLESRLVRLRWSIGGLSGVGTLLAAVGQEIWIPVSVSLAAALAGYLELRRIDATLTGYNRAAMSLENVTSWWLGQGEKKQATAASFAELVERTETALAAENAEWVQEMQEAVQEAKEGEKEE